MDDNNKPLDSESPEQELNQQANNEASAGQPGPTPEEVQPAEVVPSEPTQEVNQPAPDVSSPPKETAPMATTPADNQPSENETSTPSTVVSSVGSGTGSKGWLSRHLWRNVAIVCGILIVLLGGSAAAFFGLYLPHQPWYILDNGLKDSLGQTNVSANVSVNGAPSSSSPAFNLSSLTSANLNAKQIDENLTLNIAGASIPSEARLVNGNLYVKVSNLSSVAGLIAKLSPSSAGLASMLTPFVSAISGHWVEVNSALLDQNNSLKCMLNGSWTLSNSDSNYLSSSYLKKPFLSVNSTSNDTVNGAASYKMNVTLNHDDLASYIKGLTNLKAFKSYAQCVGSNNAAINTSSIADGKTTPMTIWIDKSNNLIDKIQLNSFSKNKFQGSITATLDYSPVSVSAPSGAEPLTQLLLQLEQQAKNSPQLQSALGSSLGL